MAVGKTSEPIKLKPLWRRKYRAFKEFGELFLSIDAVLEDFEHEPVGAALPEIQVQEIKEDGVLVGAK
jgi:hypothetical protein